eukprot:GDKI01002661.1.p1 GENE.GDKI01002661.1~~GDKI01002661.1.p1  ORF type:complete len:116 (+),score=21.95 GDKI01002661.1:125-472(+)
MHSNMRARAQMHIQMCKQRARAHSLLKVVGLPAFEIWFGGDTARRHGYGFLWNVLEHGDLGIKHDTRFFAKGRPLTPPTPPTTHRLVRGNTTHIRVCVCVFPLILPLEREMSECA